jgi:hypothetical protein
MEIRGELKSIHTSAKVDKNDIVTPVTRVTLEVSGSNPGLAQLHRWVGQDVRATIEATQLALAKMEELATMPLDVDEGTS